MVAVGTFKNKYNQNTKVKIETIKYYVQYNTILPFMTNIWKVFVYLLGSN